MPATATPSSPPIRTWRGGRPPLPPSPPAAGPRRHGGWWSAAPAAPPGGGRRRAGVVGVRGPGGLGALGGLIREEGGGVVALELRRRRAAGETAGRFAGDVLAAALSGRIDPAELRRRLEPFGI